MVLLLDDDILCCGLILPVADGIALSSVGIGFVELPIQVVDFVEQFVRFLLLRLLVGLELLDAPMM